MNPHVKTGFVIGTGAAINVECGWVPDWVRLYNGTDGDLITEWLRQRVMAFTSGGILTITAGDILQGATSTNVRATVRQVLLKTGTFAAGDAAGDILFLEEDENGSFASENVDLLVRGDGVSQDDIATVAVQAEIFNFGISTAVASVTGNAAITPYVGAQASNAKGFTIGSTISEAAKSLAYVALRNG